MGIFRRARSGPADPTEVTRFWDGAGEWEYDARLSEPPGALVWLQAWYAVHCDGEWEHGYGVHIDTLDNPGWVLRVHLRGTELQGRPYAGSQVERSEHDWVHARVVDDVFEAFGGPLNLDEAITYFRRWAHDSARSVDLCGEEAQEDPPAR
jgi:hypothetical protein